MGELLQLKEKLILLLGTSEKGDTCNFSEIQTYQIFFGNTKVYFSTQNYKNGKKLYLSLCTNCGKHDVDGLSYVFQRNLTIDILSKLCPFSMFSLSLASCDVK